MNYHDYYHLLGLPRDASPEAVRAAFRSLAKDCHSGAVAGIDTARTRFRVLNEAFEVLGKPDNKRRYDELGQQWQHLQQFAPEKDISVEQIGYTIHADGCGFSDFFENLFGYHHRVSEAGTEHDVELELYVRLDEILDGAHRTVTFQVPPLHGQPATSHTVRVPIPQGASEGSILRCPGLGEPATDCSSGDLLFIIRYEHHPEFKIEGTDLIYTLPLSPDIAKAGTKAEIPTLTSHHALEIPPGSAHSDRLRIEQEGLPLDSQPPSRGDLVVELQVG